MNDWDLACPDWAARLREGRTLVPALPLLDAYEAGLGIDAFDRLRLADVPETPLLRDAAGEWFRDIVRALFGALDERGVRHIRELFLLVPKKQSKTTYGALLMLTALILNRRPYAPFIMTAPVHDVSEIAFQAAAGAIALDPVLGKMLHVREHLKTIVHRSTRAELQIMTFDPAVVTGQKVVGALIDELHVVAKMPKAASAIRQLRGGMMPYPEAFLAFITTQSEEAPQGVFRAELQKARAIRDGRTTGAAMLPVLYEFPEDLQRDGRWRDPAYWRQVTPNAGRSVSIERLVAEYRAASETGEDELRAWGSQHLNVEVGLALHADRWPGADFWEQAARDGVTLESLLADSEVITIGIDAGGNDDLLGLAVCGRNAKTGAWATWFHAWAHPIVLERRKSEASRLLDFEAAGDLTIVREKRADIRDVRAIVERAEQSGLLDKVGVDPVGIGAILDAINEAGVETERVVAINQGWRLNGAINTAERNLADGVLVHGGQALMDWCVGNAKIEPRGNAVLITKQASGRAKIDPLMAGFSAWELMSRNPGATMVTEGAAMI